MTRRDITGRSNGTRCSWFVLAVVFLSQVLSFVAIRRNGNSTRSAVIITRDDGIVKNSEFLFFYVTEEELLNHEFENLKYQRDIFLSQCYPSSRSDEKKIRFALLLIITRDDGIVENGEFLCFYLTEEGFLNYAFQNLKYRRDILGKLNDTL